MSERKENMEAPDVDDQPEDNHTDGQQYLNDCRKARQANNDWNKCASVPRLLSDEDAHVFVSVVLEVCLAKGYSGELGLSIQDWLKEKLP